MITLGETVSIHSIRDLKRQGLTVSAIARKVGIGRKAVRQDLDHGLEAPVSHPSPPDLSADPSATTGAFTGWILNGNTVLANNANIATVRSSNLPLVANRPYRFTRLGTVLRQVA